MRSKFLPLLFVLFSACPVALRPAAATPREVEVSGTVLLIDTTQNLLSINTRLGPQTFAVTGTTVYLLNNHSTTVQNVLVGEKVAVTYVYHTSTATIVHLFQETKRSAKVVSVSANAIGVRFGGAVTTLVPDANSVVQLGGVTLTDRSILIGRQVRAIFEPAPSLKLLSLTGDLPLRNAKLTAIDTTANTITFGGKTKTTLAVNAKATLLRGGTTATLADFKVGDRVRIGTGGRGKKLHVLTMRTL